MELTTKTAVDVRASATLHPDGSISLRLTAHAEYADGMHTSVAIDDLGPGEVEAATVIAAQLGALVAANEAVISKKIQHAIHESRRVGRAEGELDDNFNPVKPEGRDNEA